MAVNNTIDRFGKFIKYKREKMGITQKELAMKAFGSGYHNYISNLETGKSLNATSETIDKILIALNSEVDFFEIKPKGDEN